MAAGLTNIQGTLALFGVFLSLGVGWTGAQMSNTALRKAIFADYDKLVIPDEKVTANLTMVIDGMSYCPHKQVFTLVGAVVLVWVDRRLAWKPEEHDGIKTLKVPAGQLWIPDITILNPAEPTTSTYVDWNTSPLTYIGSSGFAIAAPSLTFKSFCKLSGEWPWGQQNCSVVLGSMVYDETSLDIQAGVTGFNWDDINLKWHLNERVNVTSATATRTPATYECGPGLVFPRIDMNFQFQHVKRMEGNIILTPDS